MDNRKIVFLGAGMMAEAIISGMIGSGSFSPDNIFAIDVSIDRCKYLLQTYHINATVDAKTVFKNADVLFLAIKPQMLKDALNIKALPFIKDDALVVSIVAGKSINHLKDFLPKQAIIRAMPNIPLAVGEGMTVLAKAQNVTAGQLEFVEKIFLSCGEVVNIQENLMDAVTGLSGSGPGYMFLIIDALADAGVMAGLPRDISIKLAAQTVCGSGKMVLQTQKHPAQLRDQVTSPGGTTIAGIYALEKQGVRSAIIEAVMASVEKSRSFSKDD